MAAWKWTLNKNVPNRGIMKQILVKLEDRVKTELPSLSEKVQKGEVLYVPLDLLLVSNCKDAN
jgi:hypothetical protein